MSPGDEGTLKLIRRRTNSRVSKRSVNITEGMIGNAKERKTRKPTAIEDLVILLQIVDRLRKDE